MNKDYQRPPTRTITSIIQNIRDRTDRNGNPYLVLEINNDNVIFVFSGKALRDKWETFKANFEVNSEYEFEVEEGKGGASILRTFKKLEQR